MSDEATLSVDDPFAAAMAAEDVRGRSLWVDAWHRLLQEPGGRGQRHHHGDHGAAGDLRPDAAALGGRFHRLGQHLIAAQPGNSGTGSAPTRWAGTSWCARWKAGAFPCWSAWWPPWSAWSSASATVLSPAITVGMTDRVMMRVVDIIYALPFMFFVILLMVVFGRHIVLIFVAIGAVNWLDMARIVRGQTLGLKNMEFVEAARACGVDHHAIIRRHIIPNLLGVVMVYVTLTIPQVILVESFLSFLGLGVQEPMSSWGALVNDGAQDMESAPWTLMFPGGVPDRHAVLLQLHRRRHARRARSEGPGLMSAAGSFRPGGPLRYAGGCRQGGQWHGFPADRRRNAGHRRRVRFGQEPAGDGHHGTAGGERQRQRPGRVPRRGPDADDAEGTERDPRPAHRDDLPGSDDLPQPVPDDRKTDDRGRHAPPEACRATRPGRTRSKCCARCASRIRRSASGSIRTNTPAACASA